MMREEVINAVFEADGLAQCGQKLVAFVDEVASLGSETEQQEALDRFWETLPQRSAVRLDFDSPDNTGWHICPPEQRIPTYLSVELIRQDTVTEDLELLRQYGTALQKNFDGATRCALDEARICEVLSRLDAQYDLTGRLFAHQRAEIMLFPDISLIAVGETLYRDYVSADRIGVHFAFFGLTALSRISDALLSPVYPVLNEIAGALCIVSSAHGGRLTERQIPEDWLELMEEADACELREASCVRQEKSIQEALRKVLFAGEPAKGYCLTTLVQYATDQLPIYEKLLQKVLGNLSTT